MNIFQLLRNILTTGFYALLKIIAYEPIIIFQQHIFQPLIIEEEEIINKGRD